MLLHLVKILFMALSILKKLCLKYCVTFSFIKGKRVLFHKTASSLIKKKETRKTKVLYLKKTMSNHIKICETASLSQDKGTFINNVWMFGGVFKLPFVLILNTMTYQQCLNLMEGIYPKVLHHLWMPPMIIFPLSIHAWAQYSFFAQHSFFF